jgi:hypothetical protein
VISGKRNALPNPIAANAQHQSEIHALPMKVSITDGTRVFLLEAGRKPSNKPTKPMMQKNVANTAGITANDFNVSSSAIMLK